MTVMPLTSIWDQPLPPRAPRAARRRRSNERFLTIWSRPSARLPKKMARAPRTHRLPRFYI